MESLDNLVNSMIDNEANIGLFKKELAELLEIDKTSITDVWMETIRVNGFIKQYLYVHFNTDIKKENLLKIPFTTISNCSALVFDVGEVIL